ncbi:Rha family transcriptional regulator [Devosia sp.]|uniref:Rha family transcriptional regulator n=1 Tax=Devosia sp. TaxID=1871048 RepID=UPI001B01FFC0|nr:Rha family transcriptional regulator [Devosia sp.]MBO9589449.1 Rha family transcriptional regulator [Devosia sp.]
MAQAIVTLHNGQPMTNSRDVTELFGRLHKNVLQGIESLECSPEINRLNFEPSDYRDERGRLKPSYNMTKDGFTFLAHGLHRLARAGGSRSRTSRA